MRRVLLSFLAAAALTACGSPSSPQTAPPAPTSAPPPVVPVASDSPAAVAPSSPSATKVPPPRPSSTSTAAKPAPSTVPGVNYAGRLPKFGKAPQADKVHLPESGGAAWFSRIPTEQPVAFLTIDDGWVKGPEVLNLIRQADVPITLFLSVNAIKSDPPYFKRLQEAGAVIEAHTMTHPSLKGKSYEFQRREICGSADKLATWYGRRPVLFRPPFGEKDDTTMKVAADCGLKAGFFWKETVDKGIVRYQQGNTVQRGDIILMHFRDRFVDDFIAALDAIKAAGLTPALLEDYIPA